ncbi:hypothetical protein DBR28_20515 [Chryseobacterium sp. HMWF028]|nr:hypothetical protein DBR28_20515 [Chryseobacterium sp. HMWF028]
MSQTYKNLGNRDRSNEYLEKYTVLNDSLNMVRLRSMDFPVKQILEETDISNNRQKKSLYLVIVLIFSIGIIVLILFYINQRKVKKKMKLYLSYKESLILEKDEKIEKLNSKIDESSFADLIVLAKNNDSSFFLKFNEFYPEFSKRLLEINPKLQVSELTFSALIFLHFSTKDIADNTFVTISAVQLRKNRLRKKLNIGSDVDLYLWMNEIIYQDKK